MYLTLVADVRNAFKVDDLVKVDCKGLNPSDFKKIGAKLKVPLKTFHHEDCCLGLRAPVPKLTCFSAVMLKPLSA